MQEMIRVLEFCSIPLIQAFSPRRSRNQLSSLKVASQQIRPTTNPWLYLTASLSLLIHYAESNAFKRTI
ncbi:hypothetical protein BCR37DRAFT_378695 [Protomyces lactucae-debilis]|uniref:Uncharacterized protein n=1 Tax=Protomyces lactucae-debilis TaxID=2754530 RepID=A0A1Y2FIH3_PROLT|nr:uncharacterized protein BCR37DRAFT_378695 [Protomyces lactucae-debilis]ORY83723.1 hypothetical protein BCR37DRAFT_378695 [Protomyces lactucae-debilis]